jgi:hypothetical protein
VACLNLGPVAALWGRHIEATARLCQRDAAHAIAFGDIAHRLRPDFFIKPVAVVDHELI